MCCILFNYDVHEMVGVTAGGLLSWIGYLFVFTHAGHDELMDLWPLGLQLTH